MSTEKQLVELLTKASDAYYNTSNEIMSDTEYDKYLDELKTKYPNSKYINTIGSSVSNAVKLPYYMASLDKYKSNENITSWTNTYTGPYIISDKLDGVSAQLHKTTNGVYLYTRGDGTKGQDISKLIKGLNIDTSKIPINTSIRGEIIMSKNNFIEYCQSGKNARSVVSGIVNSKNVNKLIIYCDFVAYSIIEPCMNVHEQILLLYEYGLNVVVCNSINKISQDKLEKILIEHKACSKYDIDGLVVSDYSKSYCNTKNNPEHAFAFKMQFEEQKAITKVIKVLWNSSSYGYLKPTLLLESVNVGGVDIEKATAFNAKYVFDNKLGPDAVIEVIRSGDVIPYINKIIKNASKAQMPTQPYKWNDTNIDIIADDMEDNTIIAKQIEHFFRCLEIKGIGLSIISKLVDEGYKSVIEILKASREDLIQIDHIGKITIDTLFDSTEKALENVELCKLMDASHIFGRGLGIKKLKLITDKIPNILTKKMSKTELYEEIMDINGFADKTTKMFCDNFDEFKTFVSSLSKVMNVNIKVYAKPSNKTELDGKKIVLTGFRDKELIDLIESLGGQMTDSVSKNTYCVITNDKNIISSKIKKAKELNIEIYDADEFKELLVM